MSRDTNIADGARVARIMAQLNQSWDVLSTLTPAEYSAFRSSLGSSSGTGYLKRALDAVLFPELWRARTAL